MGLLLTVHWGAVVARSSQRDYSRHCGTVCCCVKRNTLSRVWAFVTKFFTNVYLMSMHLARKCEAN